MTFARILSTGAYLPEKVVTNTDLEKIVETSDDWIVQRTGIQRRHIIDENETVSSMGVKAAQAALDAANLSVKEIDMIIGATCTADQIFPSMACLIQRDLGMSSCPAFDIQAVCSGFLYLISCATQYITTGQAKRVLIVGSEAMSRVLDWKDRGTCVLFGDGAGAAILEASSQPGIFSTHLKADGRYNDVLYLNNAKISEDSCLRMKGNSLFRFAVNNLGQIAEEALKANNLDAQAIDWIVPHQANVRIIKATAKKLGVPIEKVIVTVDEHANTSAASIPLALNQAILDGRIKRGHLLLLEAVGGGLTWGAALVRY